MRFTRVLPALAVLPLSYLACVSDDPVSAGFSSDGGASSSSSSSSGSTSSSGGSDAAVDAPAAKLDGVVVDAAGVPVTGATVQVGGSGALATTGPDGKFSLDAPATYDLFVVYPTTLTTTGKAGIAIIGVTSRQPRVQVDIGGSRKASSITITTSGIAAGNFPLPSSEGLTYLFAPTSRALPVMRSFTTGAGASTVCSAGSAIAWSGDTPFTGEIHGFRYNLDPTTKLPTSFTGYGHTSFNVPENATDTITVGLTTTTVGRVTGTIDPNGSTPQTLSYALRTSGTSSLFLTQPYTSGTFDLPLLNVAGLRLAVAATGKGPNGGIASAWKTNLAIGASGVALKIPVELDAIAPADAATDVGADASFSWSPAAAGFSTYEVAIACGASIAVPEYLLFVLTKGTSATIPDQSKLGNAYPPAKSCIWSSSAMTSPDTDDLVGVGGWARYTSMRQSPGDGAFSTTRVRTFTSK